MSRKLVIFMCTVCLVGIVTPAKAAALNWNGDFEAIPAEIYDSENGWNEPSGWWVWLNDPTAQSVAVNATGGYGGSAGAVITNTDPDGLGAKLGTNWFGVSAGVSYTADFVFNEVVVAGGGWAGATAGLEFYDSAGTWLAGSYPNLWDTAGLWTSSSITIVAPAGAVNAQFQIEAWVGGGGTVTTSLDNVSVTPEPATMVLLGIGGLLALRRKHA